MIPGSTQHLTEMSTGKLAGDKGRPARKADNLTAIFEPIVYKIWETSTSHNPVGLCGLLQRYLYRHEIKFNGPAFTHVSTI
jgi:hypothetical protein